MLTAKPPIGGPGTAVEVDETLVGGVKRGKHMRGSAGKVVVAGAMQRGGEVIAKVVPNQRRATLQPFVQANVKPGGELHTDELGSYAGLHTQGYRHMTVNHGAGEYVGFAGASVNGIESFWRHLKMQHPRHAHQRERQAPRPLCERVRVPVQPAGASRFDVRRTDFGVSERRRVRSVSLSASPSGTPSASRSAMKRSRSESANACRRVTMGYRYHICRVMSPRPTERESTRAWLSGLAITLTVIISYLAFWHLSPGWTFLVGAAALVGMGLAIWRAGAEKSR